jgi:hypothetical protein
MAGIQFKRECFTGGIVYINFESMFPGGLSLIAEIYRRDPECTDVTQDYWEGYFVSEWVRKAYENARLLMLAGF